MRLLLAFGNHARQGKDQAATAIMTYFNSLYPQFPEAKILKFAEAVYQECRRDHGMLEKNSPLLQHVGLVRRKKDPLYWINKLRSTIGDFKGVGLITDLRYENEAYWVKSSGGFLINVMRLNEDGTPFVAPDRDPKHISETALDNCLWDAYIKTYTGQEALAAEQAITVANYFFQITKEI